MTPILLLATAIAAPTKCPEGRTSDNVDFEGHCCYPGQVWAGAACIGIPVSCPPGRRVDVEHQTCAALPCVEGQVPTDGQCCWPGQAWSSTLSTCKGLPRCPPGFEAHLETCARPGQVPPGHATFAVEGDGGTVWLESQGQLFRPGEPVPPGVYKVHADFSGSTVVVAGTVHLREGDEATIVCSSVFQACRATATER